MKIHCLYDQLISVSELKPHPKNRNSHPKDQIERLAKILEFQGWRYPIKVSKRSGFITSGHGRLEAAKLAGMEEVPVNFQNYESEEQEILDLTSDNAIALWSELDLSLINSDVLDLGPEIDLDLLGLKEFTVVPGVSDDDEDMTDILRDDLNKKFILEITFPNDMEMMDIHDDLVSRGYIVKVKNK